MAADKELDGRMEGINEENRRDSGLYHDLVPFPSLI